MTNDEPTAARDDRLPVTPPDDQLLPPELLAQATAVLDKVEADVDAYVQRARELHGHASRLHLWTQLIRDIEEDEEYPCGELNGLPHYMASIAASAVLRLAQRTDDA